MKRSQPEEESSSSGTHVLPWFQPVAALPSPWLMLPSCNCNPSRSVTSFYMLSQYIICTVDIPQLSDLQRCHGIYHGWFLIGNDSTNQWLLHNPVNGAEMALPRWQSKEPMGHVAVSSSPADRRCVVSSALTDHIAFCRPGDIRWSVHAYGRAAPELGGRTDFTFCNGKLYWLRSWQRLMAVDLIDGGHTTQFLMDSAELRIDECHSYNFLVELNGLLLLVIVSDDWTSCKVFSADLVTLKWVAVQSLDGHALFLGRGCSVAVLGSVVGLRGDNIYVSFHPFMAELQQRPGASRRCPRWFWLAFVLGLEHRAVKYKLSINMEVFNWEPCHWFFPSP